MDAARRVPKWLNANLKELDTPTGIRLIWYSQCGYWTDDFGALDTIQGVVNCCPKCHNAGQQMTACNWFDQQRIFGDKNPSYMDFVEGHKETCFRSQGGLLKAWVLHSQQKKVAACLVTDQNMLEELRPLLIDVWRVLDDGTESFAHRARRELVDNFTNILLGPGEVEKEAGQ